MRKFLIVAIALLAAGIAAPAPAATPAATYRLFVATKQSGKTGRLEVTASTSEAFRSLVGKKMTDDEWEALLALTVSGQKQGVAGIYRVTANWLIFESSFALVGGQSYVARFDPTRLSGPSGAPLVARFTVAPKPSKPQARVAQSYPSAEVLPSNQLKFYLVFSHPMREGNVFEHAQIMKSDGKPVTTPFREVELWNDTRTRLTLYIHPGRIKRGVKLREEIGTVLEPNRTYALVIDKGLRDADGNHLIANFRKMFTATGPDYVQPNFKHWKLIAPPGNTTAPLEVRFPEMMDYALARRLLWVESVGKKVQGTVTLDDNERRWRFVPRSKWVTGKYRLVVDTSLEDLAGNSLRKPFEVDTRAPRKEVPDMLAREFVVK